MWDFFDNKPRSPAKIDGLIIVVTIGVRKYTRTDVKRLNEYDRATTKEIETFTWHMT